jgi:hypothetical protein
MRPRWLQLVSRLLSAMPRRYFLFPTVRGLWALWRGGLLGRLYRQWLGLSLVSHCDASVIEQLSVPVWSQRVRVTGHGWSHLNWAVAMNARGQIGPPDDPTMSVRV